MDAKTLNQAELIFMQYANMGEEQFKESTWDDIQKKLNSHLELDTELLNLSELVLDYARNIGNGELERKCSEWRNLAALLRNLAHKTYRAYGDNRKVEGFLHLV